MNRKTVLALIAILAVSTLGIISVKPAFAQPSIPTPYVPEFSVTYVASSYSVNYTNSDTGATVTNIYANDTVQIVILNQAFNPNALGNGTALSLRYSVREEGHFSGGNDWNTFSSTGASNSVYTFITTEVSLYNGSYPPVWPQVTAGGQIDFQVQAFIGYGTQVPFGSPPAYYYTQWTGQNSAWSSTQTITIADGSTSTSISNSPPYPTPSPPATSNTETIWAYAGDGGSINPNGMVNVASGDNQAFTITPDSGYKIAGVEVNGVSVGAISTYTFFDVQSTENITATFTPTGAPAQASNPTSTPQGPTAGIQNKTGAGVNWTQIALFTAIAAVAALVIAVVALARRNKGESKN